VQQKELNRADGLFHHMMYTSDSKETAERQVDETMEGFDLAKVRDILKLIVDRNRIFQNRGNT